MRSKEVRTIPIGKQLPLLEFASIMGSDALAERGDIDGEAAAKERSLRHTLALLSFNSLSDGLSLLGGSVVQKNDWEEVIVRENNDIRL